LEEIKEEGNEKKWIREGGEDSVSENENKRWIKSK
jgi:hypothetical protein